MIRVKNVNIFKYDGEIIKDFINETVGKSQETLAFFIDLMEKYELNSEQKSKFKEVLINCNPFRCEYEWTDVRRVFFFNHIFHEANTLMIKKWNVKLVIRELQGLKHSTGLNELVYCQIEIGKQTFKTKEKMIDDLKFDNEIFTTQIECDQHQKALNYLVVITVSIFFC